MDKSTSNEIFLACERDDVQSIERILSHKENINQLIQEVHSLYPTISLACATGKYNAVKTLLTHPSLASYIDINYSNKTCLLLSNFNGHIHIVDFLLTSPLLKYNITINAQEHIHLFQEACRSGYVDLVDYWLTSPNITHSFDASYHDDIALYLACRNGHKDVVNFLLNSEKLAEHCNIASSHYRALNTAIRTKDIEFVNYLLTSCKNDLQEKTYYYATMIAIDENLQDMVEYLIDNFSLYFHNKEFNIHYQDDLFLTGAYLNDDKDNVLVKYLVYQKNIKRTQKIDQFIKENDAADLNALFLARDFNEKLNNNLSIDKKSGNKLKI